MEEIKKNMVNSNTFSQMLNEKKDNLVNKNGKVLNLDTDVLDINNYNYEDQIGYKENNQNAYDRLKDAFNFKKTNIVSYITIANKFPPPLLTNLVKVFCNLNLAFSGVNESFA